MVFGWWTLCEEQRYDLERIGTLGRESPCLGIAMNFELRVIDRTEYAPSIRVPGNSGARAINRPPKPQPTSANSGNFSEPAKAG